MVIVKNSSSPSNQKTNITGNKNQVAGGDIRIGVRGFNLLLILIFFIALILILTTQYGERLNRIIFGLDEEIQTVYLDVYCGREEDEYPDELSNEERKQFLHFANIAENYADEMIYFFVSVEQESAAGGCRRANLGQYEYDESRPDSSFALGSIEINDESVEQRRQRFQGGQAVPSMWVEGVKFSVTAPEWAYSYAFFLPQHSHLNAAQYKKGQYGYYLAYDGFFIVRFWSGTGGAAVHLDTVELNEVQKTKLDCIRDNRRPSVVNTLFYGC